MKIAFYKATRPGLQGLFNILVRWWTNGPYSHCELVLDEQDGKSLCGSASFIDGGVRLKWIALDPAHWDLVDVGDIFNSREVALDWFRRHQGQAYDLRGLLGFVWRRADGHPHKWVCSESVGAALGIQQPWRFGPNALYVLARTFEGRLVTLLRQQGESHDNG